MDKKLKMSVLIPGLFILTLFFIHGYAEYTGVKLSHWGVYPRTNKGLYGIFSMPLIHGSWKHLFNNAVPLFVLGSALYYFYKSIANKVIIYSVFFTGVLVWLGARPSYHIGASGLVYALASFLFLSGLIRKHRPLMALSLFVAFLYGGLIWGIFPNEQKISWEGHLFGGVSGLFWALFYKNEGPQRKKYSWEIEADILKSLDGIDVLFEKVEARTQTQKIQEVRTYKYDYKIKKGKAPS